MGDHKTPSMATITLWSLASNASGTYRRCIQASTSSLVTSVSAPNRIPDSTAQTFFSLGIGRRTYTSERERASWKSRGGQRDHSEVYERYEELEDDFVKSPMSRAAANHRGYEPESRRSRPAWQAHREAMRAKFPEGWNPPRKVSRSDMNTIRRLHAIDRTEWSTPALASHFKISPEAVRRVLSSKWLSEEEMEEEAVGDRLQQELAEDEAGGAAPRGRQSRSNFRWAAAGGVDGSDSPGDAVKARTPATPLQDGFTANKSKWSH